MNQLTPSEEELPQYFGCMEGTIIIGDNLIEPIDEIWENDE